MHYLLDAKTGKGFFMVQNLLTDMLNQAKKFIEEQQGKWEHSEWVELLAKVQKKGVELSDEAKHRFGEVLEGMKAIYHELGQTQKVGEVLNTIKEKSLNFVERNRHGWDHAAWEEFVKDIENSGIELTEAMKTYLGHVIEALKKLLWASQEGQKSNPENT